MNASHPHSAAPTAPAAVVGLFAALVGLGCVGAPDYSCHENDACVLPDGASGICEANGHCSFADPACSASGRRYADGAGAKLDATCVPVANKCVQQLSLGAGFTCALRSDGAVFCWGDNEAGQLGDGTTTARSSPTAVKLSGKATSVSVAESHSCALLADSTVWCWGDNDAGKLGIGDESLTHSATPVQVKAGPGDLGPAAPLKAKTLSAGGGHTCAIDPSGQLLCWGENQVGSRGGQCGKDPTQFPSVPYPTAIPSFTGAIAVGSGDEFSCALKEDKSAWCWGDSENGELGYGATTDSFAPVQVASLSSVGQLAVADELTCAVKNDSSLWCWGYGGSGVMGASRDDHPSPVLVTNAVTAFASGQSFHMCVSQKDGALLCWGANDAGQLGTGATETPVATPTPVKLITVETASLGSSHTCALTKDGALWCWGDNGKGQLGLGDKAPAAAPLPQRVAFPCP